MKPRTIPLNTIAPQPWKNDGGQTRELLRWPQASNVPWQLRISIADIETDGSFSTFAGVDRWFVVLDGAGVDLEFAGKPVRQLSTTAPLRFDGGAPPDCKLIDGPTRDLNLMVQHGVGNMQMALHRLAWHSAATTSQRGLFTTVAGYLHVGTKSFGPIATNTLIWFDETSKLSTPLTFAAILNSSQAVGWWLSFTPRECGK